jgi:Holliday junction resolvase YEN1
MRGWWFLCTFPHAHIFGSIWLSEVPQLTSGQNPVLENLFYKLCALLQFPIAAIFVFWGRDGPHFKGGVAVDQTPHPLTDEFQSLIKAFGFYCHTVSFMIPVLVVIVG